MTARATGGEGPRPRPRRVAVAPRVEPQPGGDGDLVAAVGRGDQGALAEIYRRYGGAVWAMAQRVCRDRGLADDVSQTVFVDLWTRPQRFDPERGQLRSWLIAQAHARAVDVVRAESARRRRHDRAARLAPPPPPPPSADVEAAIHLAGLTEHVRCALGHLPAEERDALVLAYFGGHSYRDTAALMGTPEGTVKSRIRRGLLALRRALEAEGVGP